MKLIKIIRNSGKSYRDDNLEIVFHASDKNLTNLSPISRFHGKSGLYVSESYRSIIEDWSGYVLGKKNKNHPLLVRRKEIINKMNSVEDKIEKLKKNNLEVPEELTKELDVLFDKRDIIDRQYNNSVDTPSYKTLYIHTIKIPLDILNQAEREFTNIMHEELNKGIADFGFWGWGIQTFIPAELLKFCKIINVEKLNIGEYQDKYDRLHIGRDDLGRNILKNRQDEV